MDKLEKLLSQVRVYVNEDKQHRAEMFRRGECYNVFNVLGVDNMELSHSAFLAALLDPDGSHGMRDAFLKAFIDTIAHGGTKPELDTAHAKVYTEYNIGNITETTGGRIDILITDRSDTGSGKAGGHAIIIENKIWAADQPNQLQRYDKYACGTYSSDGYLLLYLTLNGDEPSDQSKGELTDYRCISYRSDIIGWLHKCAQLAFDKPRVRETINQYINLLQQLTNQNTMEQKQLIQLLANKENFDQACAIADTMSAVKQYMVETLLREQLKDDRYEITDCKYGIRKCDGICLRPQGWKHCYIKFEFESSYGTNDLCYGIVDEQGILKDQPSLEGYEEKTDLWPVWRYMSQYRYWNNDTFHGIYSGEVAGKFKSCIEELLTLVETKHWQL